MLESFTRGYEKVHAMPQAPKIMPIIKVVPPPVEKEEDLDDDVIRCCVCYGQDNLYISKCKHVACLGCWNQWLDKALECPTCRNRTRKNQIFPMNKEDKKEIIRDLQQSKERNSQS